MAERIDFCTGVVADLFSFGVYPFVVAENYFGGRLEAQFLAFVVFGDVGDWVRSEKRGRFPRGCLRGSVHVCI